MAQPFGWMEMNFDPSTTGGKHRHETKDRLLGMPVVGFMIQEKSFGDVTKNYASPDGSQLPAPVLPALEIRIGN